MLEVEREGEERRAWHQMTATADNNFLSKAGIAGSVCAVVSAGLNPVDVTKIRMQNQAGTGSSLKYQGVLSGAMRILREEGWRGWAKGMEPSMMREMTYSSVRIGAYEPLRALLSRGGSSTETSPSVKFFSALISGGTGAALANPFDLVKTRFQAVLPGEVKPYR